MGKGTPHLQDHISGPATTGVRMTPAAVTLTDRRKQWSLDVPMVDDTVRFRIEGHMGSNKFRVLYRCADAGLTSRLLFSCLPLDIFEIEVSEDAVERKMRGEVNKAKKMGMRWRRRKRPMEYKIHIWYGMSQAVLYRK